MSPVLSIGAHMESINPSQLLRFPFPTFFSFLTLISSNKRSSSRIDEWIRHGCILIGCARCGLLFSLSLSLGYERHMITQLCAALRIFNDRAISLQAIATDLVRGIAFRPTASYSCLRRGDINATQWENAYAHILCLARRRDVQGLAKQINK